MAKRYSCALCTKVQQGLLHQMPVVALFNYLYTRLPWWNLCVSVSQGIRTVNVTSRRNVLAKTFVGWAWTGTWKSRDAWLTTPNPEHFGTLSKYIDQLPNEGKATQILCCCGRRRVGDRTWTSNWPVRTHSYINEYLGMSPKKKKRLTLQGTWSVSIIPTVRLVVNGDPGIWEVAWYGQRRYQRRIPRQQYRWGLGYPKRKIWLSNTTLPLSLMTAIFKSLVIRGDDHIA